MMRARTRMMKIALMLSSLVLLVAFHACGANAPPRPPLPVPRPLLHASDAASER